MSSTTLGELAAKITEEGKSREFIELPDSWQLVFDADPEETILSFGDEDFRFESSTAQKTILKYLKLPYHFATSVTSDLARYNVSSLREDLKSPLVARVNTSTKKVVGVFSSKMTQLPDEDILELLVEAFGDSAQVFGGRDSQDSSSLKLRICSGEPLGIGKLPDGADDLYKFMVSVSMSEVCLSPITADIGLYRLICSNGLLHREFGSQYLRMSYARMDAAELNTRLCSIADQAQLFMHNRAEKLELARTIDIGRPMENGVFTEQFSASVRLLTSSRRINQKFAEDIATKMDMSGLGTTVYSFVQAVTQYAQTVGDSRRDSLEAAAGYYLDDMTKAA